MGVRAELSVRNITGKAYEERIKDLMTSQYYDWALPCDEPPELRGHRLWVNDREPDGLDLLMIAIVSLAAKDYAEDIIQEIEYGMSNCAKRYDAEHFLSEWTPEILSGIQAEIKIAQRRGRFGLERLLNRMKVMW